MSIKRRLIPLAAKKPAPKKYLTMHSHKEFNITTKVQYNKMMKLNMYRALKDNTMGPNWLDIYWVGNSPWIIHGLTREEIAQHLGGTLVERK